MHAYNKLEEIDIISIPRFIAEFSKIVNKGCNNCSSHNITLKTDTVLLIVLNPHFKPDIVDPHFKSWHILLPF